MKTAWSTTFNLGSYTELFTPSKSASVVKQLRLLPHNSKLVHDEDDEDDEDDEKDSNLQK